MPPVDSEPARYIEDLARSLAPELADQEAWLEAGYRALGAAMPAAYAESSDARKQLRGDFPNAEQALHEFLGVSPANVANPEWWTAMVKRFARTATAEQRDDIEAKVFPGFETAAKQLQRLPHIMFDAVLLDKVDQWTTMQSTCEEDPLALLVLHFPPYDHTQSHRCLRCA